MFKKYPDIPNLGHEDVMDILRHDNDIIIVEEKVDGGNGSFWLEDDGLVHFSSRNRDLTAEEDIKTFALCRQRLEEMIEGKQLNKDYIYYIEWMQRHTITYTKAPEVIGFDIRLKHNSTGEGCGLFIERGFKEKEFKRLGIECIPLVWKGTTKELKEKKINDLIGKSKYYDGVMEGIVIKNTSRKAIRGNHQMYAKVVRDEFKEQNRAVFGRIRRPNDDTVKIADEFATDARIRKAILKFMNEDNMKLELPLMKYLPTYVIKNILKEEFNNIYTKYAFIHFKEFRRMVTKRCLRTIRTMMAERAMSE